MSICRWVSFFLVSASFLVVTACSEERFDLIEQKCGNCHEASLVYQAKRPPREWDRIIHGMKMRGLKVTPEEEQEILRFLYDTYSL